jgi:hypothetical protein
MATKLDKEAKAYAWKVYNAAYHSMSYSMEEMLLDIEKTYKVAYKAGAQQQKSKLQHHKKRD